MKKIVTEETKKAVVNDYRNSAMTMKELCEKYDVSSGSIYRWDKLLPDGTEAVSMARAEDGEIVFRQSAVNKVINLEARLASLEADPSDRLVKFLTAENAFLRDYFLKDV